MSEARFKKHITTLQKAVSSTFNSGDWKELGYETGTEEFIAGHGRLLKSLSWGDDDYEGHVFSALEYISETFPGFLRILLGKDKIKRWVKQNKPEAYADLYEDDTHVAAFTPQKVSPKEVVTIALRDAETSIKAGEPENAIDRMHTAFHGYLKAICDESSIAYSQDPAVTELFKLVYSNLAKINQNIAHPQEIEKILRAYAGSINAINTLRNHASMAHVNDLLGKDEAYLMVNAIRSMLHYLEAKIR